MCRTLPLILILGLLGGCSPSPVRTSTVWDHQSEQILASYEAWRGTPYRWGGNSRRGIDCSAFTQTIIRDQYGIALPRTTEQQSQSGFKIPRSELSPGDLVFFKTGWNTRHVGVYVGRDQFVHASESRGVTRSSLSNPYWRENFWQGRRLVD